MCRHGLEGDRAAREQPHRVAGAARADRQAGEREVLLPAIEHRVQPRAELRELARVAGELPVDAVGRERDLQHHGSGDEAPALAGREARRCQHSHHHRHGRHLVGREAAARRPARDVLRVRADEVGGEEPVGGLDGRVEQQPVLVACGEPLGAFGGGLGRERARPEQPPQVHGADLRAAADEAEQRERDGVLARRSEPVAQPGLVVVGEDDLDAGRLGRLVVGVVRARVVVARGLVVAAGAGRAGEREPPRLRLALELLLPRRRRAVDQRGEPVGGRGERLEVAGSRS